MSQAQELSGLDELRIAKTEVERAGARLGSGKLVGGYSQNPDRKGLFCPG